MRLSLVSALRLYTLFSITVPSLHATPSAAKSAPAGNKGKGKAIADPNDEPSGQPYRSGTSGPGAVDRNRASTSQTDRCASTDMTKPEVRNLWLALRGPIESMCESDYEPISPRLPNADRMLRFRLRRLLTLPEDFGELGCTSVWLDLYAKVNAKLAQATFNEPGLSHQSEICVQQFKAKMGPYRAPRSSSNEAFTSRSSSFSRASSFLTRTRSAILGRLPVLGVAEAFKATCESIDFWFLVILLAKRDHSVWVNKEKTAKEAAKKAKKEFIPSEFTITATTITMCAAYFALMKLVGELNFEQIGTSACTVDIYVTNTRADASAPEELGIQPETIASHFVIDEWQLLPGTVSMPMPSSPRFDRQPCVGSNAASCRCGPDEICPYGFLLSNDNMYNSLRHEFSGPVWDMIPEDVQHQLFPNMPTRLHSQMQNVPAELWMENFIDSSQVPTAREFRASANECFVKARAEIEKGQEEKAASNGVETEAALAHFKNAEELIQEAQSFIRLANAASDHAYFR